MYSDERVIHYCVEGILTKMAKGKFVKTQYLKGHYLNVNDI